MEFVLFHATLFILLASVLTSSVCLSSFLVSRKRAMLFGCIGFLFYFFDTAFIFQDEFMKHSLTGMGSEIYLDVRSLLSIITGCGFLTSMWLAVCDYLDEKKKFMLVGPGIAFAALSLLSLLLIPEEHLNRFVFYSMRQVFLYWIAGYALVRFVKPADSTMKTKLKKHMKLCVVIVAFTTTIVIEDAVGFLVIGNRGGDVGPFSFIAERNYAEEALMLVCAVHTIKYAYKDLSLRYEKPPAGTAEPQERRINDNIALYSSDCKLSKRESEILYLVLTGNDNQNIASKLLLSPSTVKVHIHNILKKTGCGNRTELMQDFWSKY